MRRTSSTAPVEQMSLTILEREGRYARKATLVVSTRSTREVLERSGDAASVEGHTRGGQPQLDAAERAGEHQIVEVSQVTHAEHSAFELAQAGAERHVEALERHLAKRAGIVAGWHLD